MRSLLAVTLRSLATTLLVLASLSAPMRAEDEVRIQEEIWALPLPLPMFAYLVRPVGDGPFPLVIMNHGVSLNPTDRSFFPLVEFRDAAKWFAKRGYLVVAPVGSGYGAAAIDIPERALYGPFFSKVGKCTNPNFHDAGLAVAKVDLWIIDYMAAEKRIIPKDVIVVGQSAGGWASIALSSVNPPQVKAIITFAAGRGRAGRRQAEQQLRTRQAGRGGRGFRPRVAGADAVDLHRERHVFRPRSVEAHACSIHGGWRPRRISSDAALRQRGPFLHRLAGRDPAVVAAGGEVPRRAEIEFRLGGTSCQVPAIVSLAC
ncbi:dienelactone hydrolase [Bradyrhizobium japonicum]